MNQKISFRALTACFVLGAATINASAATLDVKPGLWQMTMHRQGQGQLPLSQETLRHLSPEQRAAMEQAVVGPHNSEYQSCVKSGDPKKAEDDFLRQGGDNNCDNRLSRTTRHSAAGTFHCTDREGQVSGTFDTEMRDSSHMTGRITMTMRAGSLSLTTKYQLSGHWVGASCGNVQ